ncbi:MAG: SDR family oxidoreductase [Alphaproteobacteria bacterium]
MDEISLTGKVVIVTGAGRGLGRAMAQGLAEAGAGVVLLDRDARSLNQTEYDILRHTGNDRTLCVTADINRRKDCERAVASAIKTFGGFDVLVNNAAMGPAHVEGATETKSAKFWQADPAAWQFVIQTNVNGTYLMARAVTPHLIERGWGRIINITTSLGTMQRRHNSPYGVSKAAIEAETLIWAQDLDGTGVTVNSLIPGGASDTPFVTPSVRGSRTLLPPEIMIPPILWLTSGLSDGMTGGRYVGKNWDPGLAPAKAAARAREAPVFLKP